MSKNITVSDFDVVNNVRRHVNDFDKLFSVDINNPDENNEPAQVLDETIYQFQDFIVRAIYSINHIEIDEDLSMKELVEFIYSEEFCNLSMLDYKRSYRQNSFVFRLKFLSMFLYNFLFKVEKISYNRYRILDNSPSKYERIYLELCNLVYDLDRFFNVMRYGKTYKNIMLQVNQHCMFSSKKSDPIRINIDIRNIIKELETGIPTSKSTMKMPEDIAIDSILKLTFMLTTGKTNLEDLPKFKFIKNSSTNYDLGLLIEALGLAMKNNVNHGKYSLIFNSYIDANPSVFTKRNFGKNQDLINGIYALTYVKFFCNNKDIDKFIDMMIESTDPVN